MAKNKVTDAIRAAIEEWPTSRYQISQETGISESLLSRFVHGTRGLSTESVDTLCEYLDLELVSKQPKKR